MISAKRQAFRLEIRQRQIQSKLRSQRKQFQLQQQLQASREEREQFVTEAQNILYNLGQLAGGSDYYMYQGLLDLKGLIRGRRKLVGAICQAEYQVIEAMSEILGRATVSGLEEDKKCLVFELMMSILAQLIEHEQITSTRIHTSNIIPTIIPYMSSSTRMYKPQLLINLFCFLGNAVRDSPEIARLYTQLSIPKIVVKLVEEVGPEEQAARELMFLMRGYYCQTDKPVQFTTGQVQRLTFLTVQILDLLLLENPNTPSLPEHLEDTLKTLKHLTNTPTFNLSQLCLPTFLTIAHTKSYPLEIKRQALYIIDCIIYLSDDEAVREAVLEGQLLVKIWGLGDEDLEYIVWNVLANVALIGELRAVVLPYMSRIKLQLAFEKDSKFLWRCVLNYFTAQKFAIVGQTQQSLLQQLLNSHTYNHQTLQLQAKLWLGLVSHGCDIRPPQRILEAKNIPEVEDIWECLGCGERKMLRDKEREEEDGDGRMEDFRGRGSGEIIGE